MLKRTSNFKSKARVLFILDEFHDTLIVIEKPPTFFNELYTAIIVEYLETLEDLALFNYIVTLRT